MRALSPNVGYTIHSVFKRNRWRARWCSGSQKIWDLLRAECVCVFAKCTLPGPKGLWSSIHSFSVLAPYCLSEKESFDVFIYFNHFFKWGVRGEGEKENLSDVSVWGIRGTWLLTRLLLKNTVTRFHHTSTSHWCSCSKTISDEKYRDPFQLGRKDLKNLYEDIKKVRDFGDYGGMSWWLFLLTAISLDIYWNIFIYGYLF